MERKKHLPTPNRKAIFHQAGEVVAELLNSDDKMNASKAQAVFAGYGVQLKCYQSVIDEYRSRKTFEPDYKFVEIEKDSSI